MGWFKGISKSEKKKKKTWFKHHPELVGRMSLQPIWGCMENSTCLNLVLYTYPYLILYIYDICACIH